MKKANAKKGSGILAGLLMLVAAVCLLWYNEGRTVKNQRAINEAKKNYTDVSSEKIDPNYEGKLIATKGKMDLSEADTLTDSMFGISQKAAKMSRTVEMYQWKETCETDDNNNRNCTYEKVWESSLIDSSNFEKEGHPNPSSMLCETEVLYSENVKLGAFTLPQELIKSLSYNKKKSGNELAEEYKNDVEGIAVSGNYLTNVKENNPEIGDIRISFEYLDEENVSVLAVQKGNTFEAFTAKNGKDIYRILSGNYTGAQILEKMTKQNNTMKWILRVVGLFLMIGGFNSIFSIITNLTDRIPILGNIVSGTTGLVSAILGFALSLLIIAIAWFRFRPLLSIALLVIVAALLMYLKVYQKNQKNK